MLEGDDERTGAGTRRAAGVGEDVAARRNGVLAEREATRNSTAEDMRAASGGSGERVRKFRSCIGRALQI